MKLKIVAVAALLAVTACGKSEQSVTVKDDSGKETQAVIAKDGSTTTIKTAEGEMKIQQGGAANFPSYAPQYPGSTIASTMTANAMGGDKNGGGSMIAMTTSDSPAQVMAFYKSKLAAANMPVKMETTTPQGGMIAAGKEGDGQGVMITVGETDGKTFIAVISGAGK